MYTYIFIYSYMPTYTYTHNICTYIHICIYTYIHQHTYTHIHIYTYTQVVLTLAFYGYTAATYLPPAFDPCAPAPEVSGSRYWPLMRNALYDSILHLAISYLNLSVTLDAAAEVAVGGGGRGGQDKRGSGGLLGEDVLSEGRATMMGFHPHGIIPVSGGLISLTGQWKRLFGDLVPCMMIDFMIHIIPVCPRSVVVCG